MSDGAAETLIEYQITSNRGHPVEFKLCDQFPTRFTSAPTPDGVGEWHFEAETATFVHVLSPDSTVSTALRYSALSTQPQQAELAPPTLDVTDKPNTVDPASTTPTDNPSPITRGAEASISTFHGPNEGVDMPNSPTVEARKESTGPETAMETAETPPHADSGERPRRERVLESLHRVAVDLATLETEEDVYERTVEASEEILNFDLSTIDIEENGFLSKTALSSEVDPANTTTMSVDEGISGKTYRTGKPYLIEKMDEHPEANPQGPYQSAVSLPIGTYGVFQAVAEQPRAFDETDRKLAELLISHTESALDRIERERTLRQQNERLEAVTRIISHDLRNPMNVLRGSLEAVREDDESSNLETALDALSRMGSIVDNALTLARNNAAVSDQKAIRLDTVVSQCWDIVETGDANLDIQSNLVIQADPDQVRHLFENLFRNAIEHGSSTVTVRVGECDGGFYVEDTGPGIAESKRDDIFALDYSTTGGSGFGLSIVKQIAEAHGWEIRVRNGSTGGARFEFIGVEPPQ